MTPDEYLIAEFRRYFPDASTINVSFTVDETIECEIIGPVDKRDGMPLYIDHWVMIIGSDDDWYSFHDANDNILTIPPAPDEEL